MTTPRPATSAPCCPHRQPGCTLWPTGLPSAGKSTIAEGVADLVRAAGRPAQVLDGDDIRRHLTADLGFSRRDRDENVRRIGFVARMLAQNGVVALVPVIAPYEAARRAVRAQHAEHGIAFVEVYVTTPVDVCAVRDVKGLYAEQRAGRLTGLTGVDDPYEEPRSPDLLVPAHEQSVTQSVNAVFDRLTRAW
ncbi:MAG: adenylyl-sulfate kinase [Pseudonocardia sp.]|nr:adenylyl-sulfate kinase [Pseudonocardia sp.]